MIGYGKKSGRPDVRFRRTGALPAGGPESSTLCCANDSLVEERFPKNPLRQATFAKLH
jgi:hypothetical protein